MKTPDSLIVALMRRARAVLYKGRPDKAWFTQQDTVKKALTYPAAELEKMKVLLPAERYEEILGGILSTIGAHGDLARVQYPGAYLLHAVQQHWRIHGHEYYEEGKALRNSSSLVMDALQGVAARRPSPDTTVSVLAQVYAVLCLGKSKGRPKSKRPKPQPELFANAVNLARVPAIPASTPQASPESSPLSARAGFCSVSP